MRKPKFKIGDIVKYAHGKKEYMIDDVKTYGDNGIEYAYEEKLELVMSI